MCPNQHQNTYIGYENGKIERSNTFFRVCVANVCMSVCERERKRERQGYREGKRQSKREREIKL